MRKIVLFVCTENSARSQMAEAFFNHINQDPEISSFSVGTHPAESVKPLAVEVMREKGIDIGGQKPKPMDDGLVKIADRIITMGCIRGCPVNPPEKTEDWNLPDPGGKPVETFREVRDRIEEKVRILITELKLRSGS